MSGSVFREKLCLRCTLKALHEGGEGDMGKRGLWPGRCVCGLDCIKHSCGPPQAAYSWLELSWLGF